MQSKATTPDQYLKELPEDRKKIMTDLRKQILKNLPNGFEEIMNYGMISYVVPHTIYPNGYHCKPSDPLPFMSLASQKNFIAIYHMGMYMQNELLEWFTNEFPKHSNNKLDMGKSCIRFKKIDQIPIELIGKLASKMTTKDWIKLYESKLKK